MATPSELLKKYPQFDKNGKRITNEPVEQEKAPSEKKRPGRLAKSSESDSVSQATQQSAD